MKNDNVLRLEDIKEKRKIYEKKELWRW